MIIRRAQVYGEHAEWAEVYEDDDLMFARVSHATSGITADLDVHLTKEAALAAADFLRSVVDAAAAEFVNEPGTRCDHKPMIRT